MGDGYSVVKNYLEAERQPGQEPDVRITGLMVQYYHVCEREL